MNSKNIFVIILFSFFCLLFSPIVKANSDQAYTDYLYQSDQYRQKYNDFAIAKNQYLKFKTLTSESDVISKTKDMLSQRSLLLRAYLQLLNAKIDETSSLAESDQQLYHSLINSEISFLETHSEFVNSVSTIADLTLASKQLEEHYVVLSISVRQIIIGLSTARLNVLASRYSDLMLKAQLLLNSAKTELPLDRQTTLDRWFQKISDKRSLYLQDVEAINLAKTTLKAGKVEEVDSKFKQVLSQVTRAKQELTEGNSYLSELMKAMLYKN